MRILIFISHPAQFLFYKNCIIELRAKKHEVFILIKSKDVLADLLDEMGWKYHNILPENRGKSKFQILYSLLKRDIRLFRFAIHNKIQLLMGTDASLAHVGKLCRIACITTLEDDYDVIKNLAQLTYPYTSTILVPEICKVGKWTEKKIGYNGYMKLAYLHPNRFKPEINKIKQLEQPYIIIRLSGLSAHHDFGIKGINHQLLQKIITLLSPYAKVLISSENELPKEFSMYKLDIPKSDIHHFLYFSKMLICDSQSMAVEAAMLGTPAIRFSDFAGKISVLEELEHKYQLTYGIATSKPDQLFKRIEDLLSIPNLKELFQTRRQQMLADKIDVTAFMVWFVENYPKSVQIMKENPTYQNRFK